MDSVSHEDNIGHLFVVDIKFLNRNPKTMLFNEIHAPIFEKNKTDQAHERSTIQLMSVLSRNDEKDTINNFKCTAKTHSTLAEHIHFLVKRAGWLVTSIYQHFTFEQTKFKKDFVLMNHKSRQKTTHPVGLDFCKLLNNAKFGIDCRNNIDNCTLEPIYDEIREIAYIKRFGSILDDENYRDFYDVEIMREEVNQKCDQLILDLDKNDSTFEAEKYLYQYKKEEEDLDSIDLLEAKRKKSEKKRKLHDIEKTIEAIRN